MKVSIYSLAVEQVSHTLNQMLGFLDRSLGLHGLRQLQLQVGRGLDLRRRFGQRLGERVHLVQVIASA